MKNVLEDSYMVQPSKAMGRVLEQDYLEKQKPVIQKEEVAK